MKTEQTPALFRVWKTDMRDLFALFPTIPGAVGKLSECLAYASIGQHTNADYFKCIAMSRPANASEQADLMRELKRVGYSIRVIKRASMKMHRERWGCADNPEARP